MQSGLLIPRNNVSCNATVRKNSGLRLFVQSLRSPYKTKWTLYLDFQSQAEFFLILLRVSHVLFVFFAQAVPAWAISCGKSGLFIGEEDPLFLITSGEPPDCGKCGWTVQPSVNLQLAVSAECSGSL